MTLNSGTRVKAASSPSGIQLDEAWLTSRAFHFHATPEGRETAVAMRFAPHGKIVGCSHPNAAIWQINYGHLLILREDGAVSCIAEPRRNVNGSISLVGPWLDNPSVIHNFDEIISSSSLPEVHTFDLFDTLIARRCIGAHEIFHAVELKAAHIGFARMRIEAEASIYQGPGYSLDDIYRVMVDVCALSETAALHLKDFELAEEFANLMPILENISQVKPGDIIVTDMSLPKQFIIRVVQEVCGLHFNPVYVSSHGKSRGQAWESLNRKLEIRLHTGDNEHSDVRMPRQHGITSSLSTAARMTPNESLVQELGYGGLARAMRQARLGLWNSDLGKLHIGRSQIDSNFPLLFLSSLLLIDLASKKSWHKVLFSSRDCFLLFRLFQRLASRLELEIESTYFFTSRIARVAGSSSYKDYFTSLCDGQRTVVVDICGTGWSLTRLFEAAGRPETEMFLIHYIDAPQLFQSYSKLAPIERSPAVSFLTRNGNNALLESFNTADHRTIADVIEVDGCFVPTFVDQSPSERYSELVRYSTEAFERALVATDSIQTQDIFHFRRIVEPSHVEKIYDTMAAFEAAVSEVSAQMIAENEPALNLIQTRLTTGIN